ncbi:MAG: LCP family protein [Clostridia bacterium]|nr:LCP family protein [Clostridia bacterium]
MGKAVGSEKRLKITAVILVIVFLLSAILLFANIWERRHARFPEQNIDKSSDVIEYDGKEYVFKDNIETFLVLGLDIFDTEIDDSAYKNNQQADFLMLFVINNDEKTCSAIQINRDTMTETNILGVAGEKIAVKTQQIALAHTYGNGNKVSCRNTADAVSALLSGVKIKHYLSLTMDSVAVINDLVDGVEVEVLDDFTGIDDALVKGETVTLQGEQALRYVRTRYGMDDSTNQNRMKRQKQYVDALLAKTLQKAENDEEFVAKSAIKISEYMVSDCSVTALQTLFEKLTEYDFKGIVTIEGNALVGEKFMEFYPDEDALLKTVIETFCRVKEE